ncbi:MAG: lamin tail domain-containing protein, partial [Bacteroidota bacterium]
PANSTVQFALPDTAKSSDIVINEVLFNPYTGGVDFVELFNRSTKALDLVNLQINNADEVTGALDQTVDITSASRIMLPGEFVVLTKDPSIIRGTYNSAGLSSFITVTSLPSYNDDAGVVVLTNKAGEDIDRFIYSDKMQFALLNDDNGVSLERIDPERPSTEDNNWHSAAATVGFATPGLKNSQYNESASDGSEISIDPAVFSPDNDGKGDLLNIHYKFDRPGYTATVKIYSSTGRPVLDLVKSELLGTEEGSWSWDGINKDNEKAPVGIYVLYIEAFTAGGDTKKIKKTCVLGAKL